MTPKQKLLESSAPIAAPVAEPPRARRFLPLKAVEEMTGLRHASIYEKMSRGEFPRPVKVGDNPKAKTNGVRWIEDEIVAWQEARIAERNAAPLPKPYRPRRAGCTAPAVVTD
jgi:prophage regulatory protein